MGDPDDQETLKRRLAELRSEHRDLDDVIARIAEQVPFDQLQLQRLKKRKLQLKDEIAKIESALLPDIIACLKILTKIHFFLRGGVAAA